MKDGGPAFPQHRCDADGTHACTEGLTLRDVFASAALQGLCANTVMAEACATRSLEERYRLTAATAWCHADAMLAARGGEEPQEEEPCKS